MIIGLYTNAERDINHAVTNSMIAYLESKGVEYRIVPTYNENDITSTQEFFLRANACDIILSFGGDGTVLRLLQGLISLKAPVLGINLGNLGFLTECSAENMFEAVDAILAGEYTVEDRTVLKVAQGDKVYYAINEVTLTRGVSLHTINVEISIDGLVSDVVKGDGILVSTPLGSTAYSLSCGGPIISPELNVLSIIAICPHSLHSRPMVISNTSAVGLTSVNKDGLMRLSIDSNSYLLPSGVTNIVISKSQLSAKFVRIKEENFYKKLINKLYYWNDLSRRER